MPTPGGDPSSGTSSGDVLILPERHPACRRCEARPGSCTERENLAGDAEGMRRRIVADLNRGAPAAHAASAIKTSES